MKPLSVVVAQSNARTAESLARSLYNHFRVVNTAGSLNDLLHSIPKHRADGSHETGRAACAPVFKHNGRMHPPPRRRKDVDGCPSGWRCGLLPQLRCPGHCPCCLQRKTLVPCPCGVKALLISSSRPNQKGAQKRSLLICECAISVFFCCGINSAIM